MSKAMYRVLDGVTQKVKKMYTVVDGITRKVKKGYVCVSEKYRYLDYIQSSGTQYIDTGFCPNQNTRVCAVFETLESGGSYCCLFGVRTTPSNTVAMEFFLNNNNLFHPYFGNTNQTFSNVPVSGVHTVDFNGNVVTLDGETVTFASQTFTSAYSLYICELNQAGSPFSHPFQGKIYSLSIYDNGVLVRDYVPCINPDGAIGLFDRVGKKFYANAGTGVFTAGAETGEVYTQSVARLFFSGNPFGSYTGVYTASDITKDGVPHKLYTLTGSGTLTLNDAAQVWMCSGGANGAASTASSSSSKGGYGGFGGGGGYVASGELTPGTYTVTIGAAQGATSFVNSNGATLTAARASNQNGASGGGQGGYNNYSISSSAARGTGSGVSTYPFGITSLYAHSAGGGGGIHWITNYTAGVPAIFGTNGGSGGSNGGNGGNCGSLGNGTNTYSASGGTYGGGAGGNSSSRSGKAATYYGSGGGGGGHLDSMNYDGERDSYGGSGGAGYQGVAYVLVPAV